MNNKLVTDTYSGVRFGIEVSVHKHGDVVVVVRGLAIWHENLACKRRTGWPEERLVRHLRLCAQAPHGRSPGELSTQVPGCQGCKLVEYALFKLVSTVHPEGFNLCTIKYSTISSSRMIQRTHVEMCVSGRMLGCGGRALRPSPKERRASSQGWLQETMISL